MSAGRDEVSLILMQGSPEAQATLDVLEADYPDLEITDHDTFWKITSHTGSIEVDLRRVSEELGVEIALPQWLVIMSSYIGRVKTDPYRFTLTSDVTEIHRS